MYDFHNINGMLYMVYADDSWIIRENKPEYFLSKLSYHTLVKAMVACNGDITKFEPILQAAIPMAFEVEAEKHEQYIRALREERKRKKTERYKKIYDEIIALMPTGSFFTPSDLLAHAYTDGRFPIRTLQQYTVALREFADKGIIQYQSSSWKTADVTYANGKIRPKKFKISGGYYID